MYTCVVYITITIQIVIPIQVLSVAWVLYQSETFFCPSMTSFNARHFLTIPTFKNLLFISSESGPLDVAIVLDSSGSIGRENFYTMLNFTKSFVNSMNIDGDKHTQVDFKYIIYHILYISQLDSLFHTFQRFYHILFWRYRFVISHILAFLSYIILTLQVRFYTHSSVSIIHYFGVTDSLFHIGETWAG